MSALRVAGLLTAALLLLLVARGLARRRPIAVDLLGFGAALALALVALFPSLMDVPTELIHLGHTPGGRLIALSLLSNLLLWPYVFWSGERQRGAARRVAHQVEALTARLVALAAPRHIAPVAVVIPAYDEGGSVGWVVSRLPKAVGGLGVQAVVVADGCTDDTVDAAREAGAVVLELPVNRGSGAALRLGYDYAVRAGARVVVTMDADGQHRPEELPALVAPVAAGQADFVIGSRRLGSCERVSGLRSAGLAWFNALLNLLLATHVTDCSSGYRAFDAARLPRLTTLEDQYHTAETIMLVRRRGLRLVEVPITAPRRRCGTSKKGGDLAYGYRFTRALFTHWLRG